MDLGFDGASMGEIARAAGVSKGTLYVYFADKNRLFEAIVEEETLEQGKLTFNFDPERDVTTTLMEFGQAYIQLLCRPGGGSAIRTVMAIAERMPEVGRNFYNNVIAVTTARLAGLSRSSRGPGRPRHRRYPAGGDAIHADVPGLAVHAVYFSGRAHALARAHPRSDRERHADVSWRRMGRRRIEGIAIALLDAGNSLRSSWPGLTRPSTSSSVARRQDVDHRDKPERCLEDG